ncbi:cupin domain-containing protein [Burkholderia sp. Ac-20353]|uniref:cupin domain-containing protein n=1 Tax=Burkholderia sp. Ac-20353 TaxID=2703894 RepID=UPI00197C9AB9|nr:cupin domain-containing protein [Burkholderia sp. Ac-20353]MBN3787980.1 cupin domain-containing protein [Burkholderia sp. Ac-20353]
MFRPVAASMFFALASASQVFAQTPNPPAVTLVKETTPDGVEARLLTSQFAPNTSSPWHTHPAPVMIYVLEGTGVWEVDGLPPKTLTAGQGTLEPANKRTRVVNQDATQTLRLVLVQMSDPGKPFSSPAK